MLEVVSHSFVDEKPGTRVRFCQQEESLHSNEQHHPLKAKKKPI